MDREIINEAAWEYHRANRYEDNPYRADIMDAFGNGTSWLMQQPLSFRLTDEEKEKIKKLYHTLWGKSVHKIQLEFADIFGPDLFKEK